MVWDDDYDEHRSRKKGQLFTATDKAVLIGIAVVLLTIVALWVF